jgi:molecular chaperone GrpE
MSEEKIKQIEENKQAKEKKAPSKKKPNKYLIESKKLKEEKEELHDQLLRKIAEFDNYRKRTEREFLNRVLNANERLIADLLPVIDDMERSLAHAKENQDIKSLVEGSELIYKKLMSILEKEGLESIESTGQEFDPDKHDALMQMEAENVESGQVLDEHLKGYTLNGKVIRHAQVIVAK